MIIASVIMPILILYIVFLYITLIRRFFRIRSKMPVMGLRDGLSRLSGKRIRLAAGGILFFLICFLGQLTLKHLSPDMLLIFSYEEAVRGQNPNGTRFNESDILSDRILKEVVRRGSLKLDEERLAGFLTVSTPLDKEGLDITDESDLKISTEYWIHCSEAVSLYGTDPVTVLNLVADVYWEDFVRNYDENNNVPDPDFEEAERLEYLDVKAYLAMQARKLKDYLPAYSRESSSFRAEGSGETFASLSRKIENFIDIGLERYEAFVLENGAALDGDTYQAGMSYVNRRLETERRKDMASHDVRIEAIGMYNAFMTRFVLIPTYDTDMEFYMSRTKVGVDYFADEAKEYLESAAELTEEMEHNSYAAARIGAGGNSGEVRAGADEKIGELKEELLNLTAQCRELCNAYVREKRDGYIQVSFAVPTGTDEAMTALWPTLFFVIARGGIIMMEPFRGAGRREKRKAEKAKRRQTKREAKEETRQSESRLKDRGEDAS